MTKVIALLGQSLNSGMTSEISSPPTPHANTSMWNGSSWGAVTGNGAITLCNKLQAELGEDIQLIQASVGGSALCAVSASTPPGYWLDTAAGKPQAAFYALCTAAGVTPDVLVWNQGQQDYFSTDYSGYYNGLTTLYTAILTHFSKTAAQLPIVVQICNKCNYGNTENIAAVRKAQMDWAATTTGAFLGAATYDLPRPDGTHLAAAGYETQGRRQAVSILNAFGVPGYKYLGPKIVSGTRQGNSILLQLDLQGAMGIWPSNRWASLSGFDVWNAAYGAKLTINAINNIAPDWIRIDLAAAAPAGCHVTYQRDNSQSTACVPASNTNPLGYLFGLPMQPTAANIDIA